MNFPYYSGWVLARCLFSTYFNWSRLHSERVPVSGPVILASNHASYLDPPLVGAALPREIHYLARDSLFRFPIAGRLLRSVNAIPVDRAGASPAGLKAILDRLHDGGAIVLFPEGTRSRDGRLQPAKPGIGFVALKSNAPVVPVRIFGSFEAYGRHMMLPRPRSIRIKFGRPIDLEPLRARARSGSKAESRAAYAAAAARIMRAIESLTPYREAASFP